MEKPRNILNQEQSVDDKLCFISLFFFVLIFFVLLTLMSKGENKDKKIKNFILAINPSATSYTGTEKLEENPVIYFSKKLHKHLPFEVLKFDPPNKKYLFKEKYLMNDIIKNDKLTDSAEKIIYAMSKLDKTFNGTSPKISITIYRNKDSEDVSQAIKILFHQIKQKLSKFDVNFSVEKSQIFSGVEFSIIVKNL